MFSSLSENLIKIFDKIKTKGIVSQNDLELALRKIRISMLEADVELGVTKTFIENIKNKSIGEKVINSITPGQMIVKIVYDELKKILGSTEHDLDLTTLPPTVVLLVGLQGAGKTTTSAKLAVYLRRRYKKKVLLASLDTYRPAAQEQLAILGKQISVDTLSIINGQRPMDIAKRALEEGKKQDHDIIILDTRGRSHSNNELLNEIISIKNLISISETLLVVDSMSGQDAVNSAKRFHEFIKLTGIILTKIDGDSRGGAALSIKHVTGCPIKFIGTGEKIPDLEKFYPDRIASRILDMGDVVTLVEKTMEAISKEDAQKITDNLEKGNFDMYDLKKQLTNLKKIGGLSSIMRFIPGFKNIKESLDTSKFDGTIISKQESIINSMTKKEKKFPKIMNASRKTRVAKGAGVTVQDVNRLLKQFLEMQKMMKKMGKLDQRDVKNLELEFKKKYRGF